MSVGRGACVGDRFAVAMISLAVDEFDATEPRRVGTAIVTLGGDPTKPRR